VRNDRLLSTLLQLQVPGDNHGGHSPSGLQTVDPGNHAIGKTRGWRQVRKSLQLGRNGDEFFVEIVLDHGFLTCELRGLNGGSFSISERILLAKTGVILGPPGIP
jgi:hypothetical protein